MFRMLVWVGLAGAFAAAAAGLADGQKEAVRAATEQLREAVRRGDAAALAELYTEDVQLAMPGTTLRGRAEVRSHMASVSHLIGDFRSEDVEVFAGEDTAVETGRTLFFDRSGKLLGIFCYMTLWRKTGGLWRIHRDVSAPVGGGESGARP